MAIDILGPLPRNEDGNRYLMVVEDYFTKWTEAIPIPNAEATTPTIYCFIGALGFLCGDFFEAQISHLLHQY
jgi:hypothetical protein